MDIYTSSRSGWEEFESPFLHWLLQCCLKIFIAHLKMNNICNYFQIISLIPALNRVFSVNMAIINYSIELWPWLFWIFTFWSETPKRSIFFYTENCYVFYDQGQVLSICMCESKSTVPCWLLCLAFLLSGCELPVMSACVSCEAAASYAKMQVWY